MPRIYASRKMYDIALKYAQEYDIKCNPLKCQFINYSSDSNVEFSFNDALLNTLTQGIHLGYIIGPNVYIKGSHTRFVV